jgi:glycine cleavage system aminomethyltransferase T
VIARLDTYQKVQKRLVMLRFPAAASAAEGASLEHNGQAVGVITSVTRIPTTGEVIGLGYVRTANAAVGTRLELAAPATGWAEIEALPQLFGPGER